MGANTAVEQETLAFKDVIEQALLSVVRNHIRKFYPEIKEEFTPQTHLDTLDLTMIEAVRLSCEFDSVLKDYNVHSLAALCDCTTIAEIAIELYVSISNVVNNKEFDGHSILDRLAG